MLQIVDLLVHLVGGLYDLRVGFVCPLRHDEVNKLLHDTYVRLFCIALQQRTESVLAGGRPDGSRTGASIS